MVTPERFKKQEKLHSPGLRRTGAGVLRRQRRPLALIGLALCFALVPQLARSQTTVAPFTTPDWQFSDNSGNPLASGCVFFYAAGTTTPQPVFTDSTGTVQASNPVILNSAGRASIWLSGLAYKIKIVSAGGVNCATGTQISVDDNVTWTTPLSTFSGITVAGNENITQPTAATSGANQSSFTDCIQGQYWTGAATATDKWCWQDVLGTGSNPTTTETLSHSGSSGASALDLSAAVSTKVQNLLAGGGSPWYDVTAPPWNAKCDGVTDDTTAFNNAISTANTAGGGVVFVPAGKTCLIAGQLVCTLCNAVALIGPGNGGQPAVGGNPPVLTFSSSTSPLVDIRSSGIMKLQGIKFVYTNAAFTGRFIDLEHNGVNGDSQGDVFRDLVITGTSTAKGATCLLCMDNADNITVDHVGFEWAVNFVSAPFSNQVHLHMVQFSNPTGTVSGAFIVNPGNAFKIDNSDFEMGTGAGNASIIDCTNCGTNGTGSVNFGPGNWVGDTTVGSTVTYFKNMGAGGTAGFAFNVQGNYISGDCTSNLNTLMTTVNSAKAFNITGNTIGCFATDFSLGTGQGQWAVSGNNWFGANTTFLTGTPGTGSIVDNNGITTMYTTGSKATPALSFGAGPNGAGFYLQSAGVLAFADNNSNQFLMLGLLERFNNNEVLGWSSGDPTAVVSDTGISRCAAGVVCIGVNESAGNAAGTIKAGAFASGTNCQLGGAAGTTSPAACGSAAAGMIAVPASQTSYQVNTTAVTANSEIIVQQMTDNSGLPSSPTCNSGATTPIQSARSAATSFTITLTSVASVTCFKYWIIN